MFQFSIHQSEEVLRFINWFLSLFSSNQPSVIEFAQVLYVPESGGGIQDYDPEAHQMDQAQFLVWPDLIIVGDHEYHEDLFNAYQEAVKIDVPSVHDLIGAGKLLNGRVQRWRSSGYDFTTPVNMRPSILAAIDLVG